MLLDADDFGDDDLVRVPDRAAFLRLDAHALRDRQAKHAARPATSSPAKRQALDELRPEVAVIVTYSRSQFRGIFMVSTR